MAIMRNIIEIDEELCNGCGQCILDCAEGALELVDGKAKLVGEIYCDGLGACLSGCPTGALTVTQKPAEAFDEEAVEKRLEQLKQNQAPEPCGIDLTETLACGCSSSQTQKLTPAKHLENAGKMESTLEHWPIKLQLLSPQAPFLNNADLVLLADCAGTSLPNLHADVLPGKAIALACPKLDDPQAHIDKLADILAGAQINSVTVLRMEVPCCKGLAFILEKAMEKAGVSLKVGQVVISRDGKILETENADWLKVA